MARAKSFQDTSPNKSSGKFGSFPSAPRPTSINTVEYSGQEGAATAILVGRFVNIEILHATSGKTTAKVYSTCAEAKRAFDAAKEFITTALGMEEVYA